MSTVPTQPPPPQALAQANTTDHRWHEAERRARDYLQRLNRENAAHEAQQIVAAARQTTDDASTPLAATMQQLQRQLSTHPHSADTPDLAGASARYRLRQWLGECDGSLLDGHDDHLRLPTMPRMRRRNMSPPATVHRGLIPKALWRWMHST